MNFYICAFTIDTYIVLNSVFLCLSRYVQYISIYVLMFVSYCVFVSLSLSLYLLLYHCLHQCNFMYIHVRPIYICRFKLSLSISLAIFLAIPLAHVGYIHIRTFIYVHVLLLGSYDTTYISIYRTHKNYISRY